MRVKVAAVLKKMTSKIGFFQPLIESVINAFTANATDIKIKFTLDADNKIVGYVVTDDGDGFTDANIVSFLELWSEHNIKHHALGSGRVLCLKVFENMIIESHTKANKLVNIDFNKNFDKDYLNEINIQESPSSEYWTKVTFKNKHSNYDILFDDDQIKNQIFIDFLPLFLNFKQINKKFSISINGDTWLNQSELNKQINSQAFKEKRFTIKEEEFVLTYRITNDQKHQIYQFYAAANRKVKVFPDKNVKIKQLPNQASAIFCLTAEYFQTRTKDERNGFTFDYIHNPTKEFPILLSDINLALNQTLNTVIKEAFPEIESDFEQKKQQAIENYPFLSHYIRDEYKFTATESEILKIALEKYQTNKENKKQRASKFLEKVTKNNKSFKHDTFKEIQGDFNTVGKEMLADYIGYRQTIVQTLLEISPNNSEKNIHDLFMVQNTTSDGNGISKYANNVWIFDDKFMSFNYAASDKRMQKIINSLIENPQIQPFDKGKKPDLIMSYSNHENQEKDVLLVEFKKKGAGQDSNFKALTQLKLYPRILKSCDKKIRSIFAYTILDLDDEFRENLTHTEGFVQHAFGDKDNNICWYYNYNKTVKAHLNVVSFDQVLKDAFTRNKVFLDILKNLNT